jgi:hypothetical protein
MKHHNTQTKHATSLVLDRTTQSFGKTMRLFGLWKMYLIKYIVKFIEEMLPNAVPTSNIWRHRNDFLTLLTKCSIGRSTS